MFSEIYFALYERQKRITFFIISVPSTGHSMVTCPVTLTEGRFVKRMNEVRFVERMNEVRFVKRMSEDGGNERLPTS